MKQVLLLCTRKVFTDGAGGEKKLGIKPESFDCTGQSYKAFLRR